MSTMITTIGTLLSSFFGWIGDFVEALFSPATAGPDLSVLGAGLLLGLVCSIILFAVKVIRKVFWGA